MPLRPFACSPLALVVLSYSKPQYTKTYKPDSIPSDFPRSVICIARKQRANVQLVYKQRLEFDDDASTHDSTHSVEVAFLL